MSSTDRARPLAFGLGAFVCLGGLGALLWLRKHDPRSGAALGAVGALLLLLAFVAPSAALAVRAAWMRLGGLIGWVNARILLTVFFFVALTPIALLRRLFGRSPLDTAWKPGASPSYWKKREAPDEPERWDRPY